MQSESAIADTVVLRYFLLVDRFELLLHLLGEPVMVSRVVFDPEDTGHEIAMSENGRSIHVQAQRSVDATRIEEERIRAELFTLRLGQIQQHVDVGSLAIVDMTESEQHVYSRLNADEHAAEFGLTFALGDGEAASLAIAQERGWVFTSDDTDALFAMRRIRTNHPYRRIRRILVAAADLGLVSPLEANSIHQKMRGAGFWDVKPPYAN